jgi:protein arginine kinase activator
MTYTAFREQGRLGCAGCYDTFSTDIDKMLKEMHGSCEHRGKRYSRVAGVVRGTADDLARLRGELDRAIGSENFEEAARLRDTISALVSQES